MMAEQHVICPEGAIHIQHGIQGDDDTRFSIHIFFSGDGRVLRVHVDGYTSFGEPVLCLDATGAGWLATVAAWTSLEPAVKEFVSVRIRSGRFVADTYRDVVVPAMRDQDRVYWQI